MRRATLTALCVFVVVVLVEGVASGDDGWVIERFHAEYEIGADGSLAVREELDVDFRDLGRRGIFRDIVSRQIYDAERDRRYELGPPTVTSADGRALPVAVSTEGPRTRFRIGDPDVEVTGRQTYRISYAVRGALNAFAGHDELYWNASGTWPVRIEQASVAVRPPQPGVERATCFQGAPGSNEACRVTSDPETASFVATRQLDVGEQVTIVVGLVKGTVTAPTPILVARPRDVTRFFDATPGVMAVFATGVIGAVGAVGTLWWRVGRDRRFVSLPELTDRLVEEPVPLLDAQPIAVQFRPPDGLRPAQLGLLMDERADTLDITATIIDLAVRGHLRITETTDDGVLGTGWFAGQDWQLDRLEAQDDGLLEYERIVLNALFDGQSSRSLSSLENVFYTDLTRAKKALYRDAMERQWFYRSPRTVRAMTRRIGLAIVVAGLLLTGWLGQTWGHGLAGLPVLLGGLLLVAIPRAMPRRTGTGREVLRRGLGFARYIQTAETHRQAFAERAGIFTEYLPYAVAFRAVHLWAHAFEDIDLQPATRAWYHGPSHFDAPRFSSALDRFGSTVTSTLSSTPGGSGGSGFSGGSAGGGGGGGGGGSW